MEEQTAAVPVVQVQDEGLPPGVDQATAALVTEWRSRIAHARDHSHKKAFARMRVNQQWAAYGASKEWADGKHYIANIIGQHVQAQAAVLYAKNPKVVVKPQKLLDYAVWDGSLEQLETAQQAMMPVGPTMPGMPPPPPSTMDPELALEIVMDYQLGSTRKQIRERVAKTLEPAIQATWDLEFKMDLKQAVRRALTCGVAYVRADLYRETSRSPSVMRQITDTRTQIANVEALIARAETDQAEHDEHSAELEQLRRSVATLEESAAASETIEREGVIYSFPASTSLIPDPATTDIMNFRGADWVAEEFGYMTRDKILASYGVDVLIKTPDGKADGGGSSGGRGVVMTAERSAGNVTNTNDESEQTYCVYEVWKRDTREVFVICEEYDGFLVAPHSPPVYTKRFWPWVVISFNCQDLPEGEIFPPSDVQMLMPPQDDINQARQGLREHRRAGRPLYITSMTALLDEEIRKITDLDAYSILRLTGFDPSKGVEALMVPLKKAPLDPGAYDTSPHMADFEIVGGGQQAHMGSVSGSTATENAIAEESRNKTVFENVDGLNDSMSALAEMVGHMMLDAYDPQTIIDLVGPGAVWPDITRREMADQLTVSIRAGSSGRPNQAMEIANLERLAPYLERLPNLDPLALARMYVERLGDDMDIDELMSPGQPAIATVNTLQAKPPPAPGMGPEGGVAPAADPAAPPSPDQPPQEGTGPQFKSVQRGGNEGAQPAFGASGALG